MSNPNQPDSEEFAMLSPDDMLDMLEDTLDRMTTSEFDRAKIEHMLGHLEAKQPLRTTFDPAAAWNEMEARHSLIFSETIQVPTTEHSAFPFRKTRRRMPALLAAVLAITILLMGMITAQAAGIDVFGRIGRWTNETFHFVSSSSVSIQNISETTLSPEHAEIYDSLQTALNDCGITGDLVPTWYPEGAEVQEFKVFQDDYSCTVNAYFGVGEKIFFNINITQYQSMEDLNSVLFEKDNTVVTQYETKLKTFYIMSNIDTVTATCANGFLIETISGNLPIDEVKSILDSIGG